MKIEAKRLARPNTEPGLEPRFYEYGFWLLSILLEENYKTEKNTTVTRFL